MVKALETANSSATQAYQTFMQTPSQTADTTDFIRSNRVHKTLPKIAEAKVGPTPGIRPNSPIFNRLSASWKAKHRREGTNSADLGLCLIALIALALAMAGRFGWF